MNVYEFLQIPATMLADQEILVDGGCRLTYGELLERVHRLADGLRQRGFSAGERAAALATNSHRCVEAYLATAALGGAFMPLNYRARAEEVGYMLAAGRATTLFHAGRYRGLIPAGDAAPARRIDLDAPAAGEVAYEDVIAAGSPEFVPEAVDEDAAAVLMYTSGTTSRPKGVRLTHGDFTLYLTQTVEMADGTPRGTMLMAMPLYHIAGAINVLSCLFSGRRLVLLPQFDAGEWLRAVERERATHSFLVPTMLRRVLEHPDFEATDLSSLENLAYGGAPMPLPVITEAIGRFPRTTGFVNAFGQTETTSTLCVLGPEDHRLEGSPEEVEARLRRLGSVGRPLPDVEIRIAGDDGRPLPPGQIGQVWVRTPRLMAGYEGVADPGRHAEGWHGTGDLGWLDEGGYLFLAGRADDLIIRGGENISPAEIEATLQAHPAVAEAAVMGIEDVEWGQTVAAAVALRPGQQATAEALQAFVRERLAGFKKPDRIVFVDALPRTATGKVIKRELKPLLAVGG